MPQKDDAADQGHAHPDKPPLAHPCHPGHDDEDEQIDQHHAPVAGQHRQQPGEHAGEDQVLYQGGEPAQALWPLPVDHPGQHHDIGQLGDLPRLKAGKAGYGEVDPAFVAAVPTLSKGLEEQDDEQPQQQEHPPPLFHQILNVDEGDPHIGYDAQA